MSTETALVTKHINNGWYGKIIKTLAPLFNPCNSTIYRIRYKKITLRQLQYELVLLKHRFDYEISLEKNGNSTLNTKSTTWTLTPNLYGKISNNFLLENQVTTPIPPSKKGTPQMFRFRLMMKIMKNDLGLNLTMSTITTNSQTIHYFNRYGNTLWWQS